MARIGGFILLIVLIYLMLISLISMNTLMQIKQDLRLQNQIMRNENLKISARAFIKNLEQQVDVTCFKGCNANGYYYKYDFLGHDPCAILNEGEIASYYRVMVKSDLKQSRDIKIFMQCTFVVAVKSNEVCTSKKHVVFKGEQVCLNA